MDDLGIRLFAFDWLKDQIEIHSDVLPRELLLDGFSISGERYGLVGPQGIWKPKSMKLPISITTVMGGPYPDIIDPKSGILNYKYRGVNRNHRDNAGLRELMKNGTPLIFFYNISRGKYVATWPVYIIQDNPNDLSFNVMVDDMAYVNQNIQCDVPSDNGYERRAYITATTMIRVHQRGFRERVLRAYRNQCALCKLKHVELLDAAHIIADKEDIGDPIIQNGLSLCKIHHAAFDKYIIGINPDYKVKVRKDILEEVDGPMLKYGLQSLDNNYLILPEHKSDWPDRERLDIRFNGFLNAG
jgi:putative restriction endonuclease